MTNKPQTDPRRHRRPRRPDRRDAAALLVVLTFLLGGTAAAGAADSGVPEAADVTAVATADATAVAAPDQAPAESAPPADVDPSTAAPTSAPVAVDAPEAADATPAPPVAPPAPTSSDDGAVAPPVAPAAAPIDTAPAHPVAPARATPAAAATAAPAGRTAFAPRPAIVPIPAFDLHAWLRDNPASPAGAAAVAIAERYLGVPYVWGGASPATGFDCSGLTQYVYAQLGIHLPHYAAAQFEAFPAVDPSELAPGDLVFFEPRADGPGHVALYAGDGLIVEAPHTGALVRISTLAGAAFSMGFVGAVRPYAESPGLDLFAQPEAAAPGNHRAMPV